MLIFDSSALEKNSRKNWQWMQFFDERLTFIFILHSMLQAIKTIIMRSIHIIREDFSKTQNKKLMCSLNYSLFSCSSFFLLQNFWWNKKKGFERTFYMQHDQLLLCWWELCCCELLSDISPNIFLCVECVINFSFWHHWFIRSKKGVIFPYKKGTSMQQAEIFQVFPIH